ncbi:MAG: alpha/beta hydrolase [Dehalococcoidia bacterium]|nr:alpha/beta hydrolase [Dehalococcoidia bacterium]
MANEHGYAGYGAQYSRATAQVAGLAVPYLKGGYGDPLLYLHGLGGWGQWERHIYALAVTNTVYAPQLPGWRDGELPEGINAVKDYARVMAQFLDTVGVPRCVVVGHSLGGWVALHLAEDYADKVSKLVLVDCMGIDVPEAPTADLATMDEDAFAKAAFISTGEVLITGDFGTLFENVRTGPEFEKHWKGREVALKLLKGRTADPALTKGLRNIKAQTLIVWGADDTLVPQQHARVLASAIPGAKLAVIKRAGHMPMRYKPETFNRVVHDFLLGQESVIEDPEEDLIVKQ